MKEWKIQSIVGGGAAAIYVIITTLLSLPYLVELALVLAVIISLTMLGRKWLQQNEEKQ